MVDAGDDREDLDLALCAAVMRDDVSSVSGLLGLGADADTMPGDRSIVPIDFLALPVLGLAVVRDRIDIARLLLRWGARLNAPDRYGWAPLSRVVSHGSLRGTRHLIEL